MNEENKTLDQLTDEQIVSKMLAGQSSAAEGFEELANRLTPYLYRTLFSRYSFAGYDLVADAVAETLVTLLVQYDQYDPERGKFRHWALGIARNKTRVLLRKESKHKGVSLDTLDRIEKIDVRGVDADIMALTEYRELQEQMASIYLSLSDRERLWLSLRLVFNLTFEELAAILNEHAATTGEKTVTSEALAKRYSRVVAKMREAMETENKNG